MCRGQMVLAWVSTCCCPGHAVYCRCGPLGSLLTEQAPPLPPALRAGVLPCGQGGAGLAQVRPLRGAVRGAAAPPARLAVCFSCCMAVGGQLLLMELEGLPACRRMDAMAPREQQHPTFPAPCCLQAGLNLEPGNRELADMRRRAAVEKDAQVGAAGTELAAGASCCWCLQDSSDETAAGPADCCWQVCCQP